MKGISPKIINKYRKRFSVYLTKMFFFASLVSKLYPYYFDTSKQSRFSVYWKREIYILKWRVCARKNAIYRPEWAVR